MKDYHFFTKDSETDTDFLKVTGESRKVFNDDSEILRVENCPSKIISAKNYLA